MTPEEQELYEALRAEHKALHAWMLGQLLHIPTREQHERYSDLIDAHDAVATLWVSDDDV